MTTMPPIGFPSGSQSAYASPSCRLSSAGGAGAGCSIFQFRRIRGTGGDYPDGYPT
jgi:hypothetical protein